MTKFEGGCMCGAVRYVANAAPLVTRICWCRVCQYLAAGNATVNLAFPAKAVTVTGELKEFSRTAASGNHMHQRFCPVCGVHLFSAADERPHILVVRAGTLDAPESITPEAHIWTSSAPAWALLHPDLPHIERQPPAPVVKD